MSRSRWFVAPLLTIALLAAAGLLAGCASTVSTNVAPVASVSASSEDQAEGRTAAAAVDGIVGASPSGAATGWGSADSGAGAWIQLTWPTPQLIDRIVLYAPAQPGAGVAASRLTFDDGSTVSVGALPQDGSASTSAFAARRITSLRFWIDEVRPGTEHAGLSELQVWTVGRQISPAPSSPSPSSSAPSGAPLTPPACAQGSAVNVIAHPDDDLLFLNPTVQDELDAGLCVRTVVLTAGDNGLGPTYWRGREEGLRAAYSTMAGTANAWTKAQTEVGGRTLTFYKMNQRPEVSLAFLELPDGNIKGEGFPSTGGVSLSQLVAGRITTMETLEGDQTYSREALVTELTGIVNSAGATRVATLDPRPGPIDHSDHAAVAQLTETAVAASVGRPPVDYFVGYGSEVQPTNVDGTQLAKKKQAYYAYAAYDADACKDEGACQQNPNGQWLPRMYEVPR